MSFRFGAFCFGFFSEQRARERPCCSPLSRALLKPDRKPTPKTPKNPPHQTPQLKQNNSWLIAIAYFLAGGFIKSGLGNRIAYGLVSAFGKTTLGLTYALVMGEALLSPMIPSGTSLVFCVLGVLGAFSEFGCVLVGP